MFVSLHMSPQSRGEAGDLERIDELIDSALLADRAAVASIALTEHHLSGFNSYCDPFMLASHLARSLTQAYVAIHVVRAPFQHPVRMAEQCNILDVLTRGRCMIAVATGSVRQIELDAFGVAVGERSAMTSQRLESMLSAWSWSDETSRVDVPDGYDAGRLAGRLTPASYRKPHPLVGRATLTPETIVDTARRGLPLVLALPDAALAALYRPRLERLRDPREPRADGAAGRGAARTLPRGRRIRADRDFAERGHRRAGPGVAVAPAGEEIGLGCDDARNAGRSALAAHDLGVGHLRVGLTEIPGEPEQNRDALELFIAEVLPQLDPQRLRDPARTVLTEPANIGLATE
jgi:alkanesulfonate monooxygenase SsuD/methylene tetrahydromethanopterin reductase-like flavin-dependent oxidoreductase (luciferase family)